MTKTTFQGRISTTNGRPSSVVNRDTGLPMTVLRQNMMGPIHIPTVDLGDEERVIGMLPAFWVLSDIISITPPGAGTLAITLPAYAGMAEVALVADGAVPAKGASFTIANGQWEFYGIDRPLMFKGTGVTGAMLVTLMGFPYDDATHELS